MPQINFKPITLADKPAINALLAQIHPIIVEQSFNTLFPWQQPHAYHWAQFENWLLIRTTYQGRTSFLPPLGRPRATKGRWRRWPHMPQNLVCRRFLLRLPRPGAI